VLQLEITRAGIEGDVELAWAEQIVTVETTSLSRADADLAHQRFESDLRQSLHALAWTQ
jgi:hypothetical protein